MIGTKIIKDIRSGVSRKYNFSKEFDGIEYFIQIEDFDRFSMVLKEIGLRNAISKGNLEFDDFKNKIQTLENKLSYFIDQLKLFELSKNDLVAQLRSKPSETEKGVISYYEILFSEGNKINFYKIANKKGDKEKVNMIIPDNILVRLIDDFCEIIGS